METASEIREGDKIELRLEIRGAGQLDNVLAPDLCCQPGFSGLFKTSDLPAVGKVVNKTKTFQVEIYPLFTAIKTVPPIEFSFFDPVKEKYESILSPGIPIKIMPSKAQDKRVSITQENPDSEESLKPIHGNYSLTSADVQSRPFGSYWVLGFIPAGLVAIFFQYAFIQEKRLRNSLKALSSHRLLQEAKVEQDENNMVKKFLEAFQVLLFEKGLIATPFIPIEEFPDSFVEIKRFFANSDAVRFANLGKIDKEAFRRNAESLFLRLEE